MPSFSPKLLENSLYFDTENDTYNQSHVIVIYYEEQDEIRIFYPWINIKESHEGHIKNIGYDYNPRFNQDVEFLNQYFAGLWQAKEN